MGLHWGHRSAVPLGEQDSKPPGCNDVHVHLHMVLALLERHVAVPHFGCHHQSLDDHRHRGQLTHHGRATGLGLASRLVDRSS